MKFRFSTLNQQAKDISTKNIFFDIGAIYNFPIYFKQIIRFDNNTKLVNSFIHQYTDVRLYSNIGYKSGQLFMEYRPLNFIIGSLPEMPKYNIGLKFLIND